MPVRIMCLHDSIDADVQAISSAVHRTMNNAKYMECMRGSEAEIAGVLHEALANAVTSGCQGKNCKKVHFSVSCNEGQGTLILVWDERSGFNPASAEEWADGKAAAATQDRGIIVINQLTDEVHCLRGRGPEAAEAGR